MESGVALKNALVAVRQALKAQGFSAKGTTFYRKTHGGNTVVLSVQKSVKSSPAEAEVTLNYGAYSARLGSRLHDDASSALDITRAHWRKRLREDGREKWLHVKATDAADAAGRVILAAVEGLLPEVLEHASDEALRDEWLAGSSPGLTDMQRLLFAAILVNEIGPAERLPTVIGELRHLVAGSIHQGLVEGQLTRAGVCLAQ
jgi:hypothetical protein